MNHALFEPTHDTLAAKALRKWYHQWGWCLRCGYPWAIRDGHTTQYNAHAGCFPLCEGCWDLLAVPEARIEYYGALLARWAYEGFPVSVDDEHDIKMAVANGG